MKPRVPPGRSGLLWLVRRLATARRGLDLLDRKQHVLTRELDRLQAEAERARARWVAASGAADDWGVRVAVAGGQRALRLGAPAGTADVAVTWRDAMGTTYPDRVECTLPDAPRLLAPTTALPEARRAYREAVVAAAEHAAAATAAAVVAAEVEATRRRIRSLRDRWIPAHEEALAALTASLDEQERADGVRLRMLIGARPLDRER